MGIKSFKPTSPARRFYSVSDFKELTKGATPTRSLLEHQTRTGGRNHNGRITSRFRGGGHKQRYRSSTGAETRLAFRRALPSIEYDPIARRESPLHYVDGEKRYILAPDGLTVGDKIISSRHADISR